MPNGNSKMPLYSTFWAKICREALNLFGVWKSAHLTRDPRAPQEQEMTVSHWPTIMIGPDGDS